MTPADFIWDVETFPNVFTMSVRQADTDTDTDPPARWQFEISHRRNDLSAMVQFLNWLKFTGARMVGFNNLGFDYPVLHYILYTTPTPGPREIYEFAMAIIKSGDKFKHQVWEKNHIVKQLDLYKIHNFDNAKYATSLKLLEFAMRSRYVQELPFPPGTILTDQQINVLLDYNMHDVDETYIFYLETLPAIRFREELSIKYGADFTNCSDAKIGEKYLIMELEKKIPGSCYTQDRNGKKVKRQTIRTQIALKDVLFPWIKFKRPEFIRIYDWFASQVITSTKGVFEKPKKKKGASGLDNDDYVIDEFDPRMPPCIVDGFKFVFGTGGIHGSIESQTIYEDEEYELVDVDVESYYPSLGIVNKKYPEHLGPQFPVIYREIQKLRTPDIKKTPIGVMLKLALNAAYGKSNSVYSCFYDPQYTMTITINGQLLLCLLSDYLLDIPGLSIIQINTDGVTVKVPRNRRSDLQTICDWWQAHTCLKLEQVNYKKMFIRDVNGYIAESVDGKIKRKGPYESDTKRKIANSNMGWNQDFSAMIVPMAAEALLFENIPVRDTILNHDDIFDFMLRARIPRGSKLMIGNQQTSNVCRYYVSKTGGEMVKIMPPLAKAPDKERRIGINVGWLATECNDIRSARGTDINFEYYIQEAEKLVLPLLGQ